MAVDTKASIFQLLASNRERLHSLGVLRLGLFGSFVRGQQHPASDIDVLVEFQPERKSFDNFMALSLFLEDLLQRPVEVLTLESLSPHIGPRILKEVEYAALNG